MIKRLGDFFSIAFAMTRRLQVNFSAFLPSSQCFLSFFLQSSFSASILRACLSLTRSNHMILSVFDILLGNLQDGGLRDEDA